jgi:DNA-binding NtrC family response regulator
MKMPKKDGLEVLRELVRTGKLGPTMMMTAHSTVATAVEAIKLGAEDYICKPFDVDELIINVSKVLEMADLKNEVECLRTEVQERYGLDAIIGHAPKMLEIQDVIRRVAQSRSTVLITGESGTGKELIAHAIHYMSPRAHKRFVKVNCAALSETLLESELFGHRKGSFTGATENRVGRFELAKGGTILLDEVSEMSPKLQAKLLRVLQEREVEPVGASEPIPVDVRLLATTNRRLADEIEKGRFREDLFFRLNVVSIEFPPLRERREDIPLLAGHFLWRYREEMNKKVEGISPDAMDLLTAYSWPGNVRELENAIERGVVLCIGRMLEPHDLPPEITSPQAETTSRTNVGSSLAEAERDLILRTLKSCGGNRSRTADVLGISVRTLRNKLKEYSDSRTESTAVTA